MLKCTEGCLHTEELNKSEFSVSPREATYLPRHLQIRWCEINDGLNLLVTMWHAIYVN